MKKVCLIIIKNILFFPAILLWMATFISSMSIAGPGSEINSIHYNLLDLTSISGTIILIDNEEWQKTNLVIDLRPAVLTKYLCQSDSLPDEDFMDIIRGYVEANDYNATTDLGEAWPDSFSRSDIEILKKLKIDIGDMKKLLDYELWPHNGPIIVILAVYKDPPDTRDYNLKVLVKLFIAKNPLNKFIFKGSLKGPDICKDIAYFGFSQVKARLYAGDNYFMGVNSNDVEAIPAYTDPFDIPGDNCLLGGDNPDYFKTDYGHDILWGLPETDFLQPSQGPSGEENFNVDQFLYGTN